MSCWMGQESGNNSKTSRPLSDGLAKLDIPIIGYNFSIAGVCGRIQGPFARGEAVSVGMDGPLDTPMPRGMAWNMVYDPQAEPGTEPPITHEMLWQSAG